MSNDEKKFSLDELPDEGSQPVKKTAAPKKLSEKPLDPRVTNLKNLKTDSSKVEMMVQTWTFDVPEYSFFWVPWAATICIAEWSGYFSTIEEDLQRAVENPFALGADVIASFISFGTVLMKHPIILLVLIPVFFRFRKQSEYFFEVKFDGLNTVKKFIPRGSKEQVHRTLIRWDNIKEVKKGVIDDKEILRFTSLDGHIGDLIWYIDIEKKRALKLLLSGMISPKNPLRVFLDNEKELK